MGFTSGKGDATTYDTGTTTVGIVAEEGVVLAADRRVSLGGRFVGNKDVTKVEQVHPTAAVTISGTVGAAQAYVRSLRAETSLYGTRRDEPMSMDALARLAGDALRGQPVGILLGGVDPETGEGRLFEIDGAGGVMEDVYAATGSGMQVAYGTLESSVADGMTMEEAVAAARTAVRAASERDTASGNGLVIARVTSDGVETTEED
jgi:proteasome beta subunit